MILLKHALVEKANRGHTESKLEIICKLHLIIVDYIFTIEKFAKVCMFSTIIASTY